MLRVDFFVKTFADMILLFVIKFNTLYIRVLRCLLWAAQFHERGLRYFSLRSIRTRLARLLASLNTARLTLARNAPLSRHFLFYQFECCDDP